MRLTLVLTPQNDLASAWNSVSKLTAARIDIILDNSGFELYADLIFTLYLLRAGIADTVVLHPKSIPWSANPHTPYFPVADDLFFRFVSDVTPPDIGHLFSSLSNPAYFSESEGSRHEALDFLVSQLTSFYAAGRIIIRPHDFWTTQHSYWRLPSRAPDLLADLEESDLLVFKGDLNYRKYCRPRLIKVSTCTC